ncbi:MAG: lipopolysaccharide biosynthesis protein [Acidimicrobiales bacterium]
MTGDMESPPADALVDAERSSARAGVILFIALSVANASNYLFQVVASRLLGPADYSLMGGIFAIVTVVGVSTSALQTSAAKIVAANPKRSPIRLRDDELVKRALKIAIPVAILFAFISPLVSQFLRAGIAPSLFLALYLAPAPLLSIGFGRLQGLQAFGAFAALSLGLAGGRLVVTTGVLALGAGVTGVMATAFLVTAVGAWVALHMSRGAAELPLAEMWKDTGRATVALVLFWVLVSIDVPIARHALSAEAAGQYTAASVIGKAVLWLPGAISLVMFPKVAQARQAGELTHPHLVRALVITLGLCGGAVVGMWALGSSLIPMVFGETYAEGAGLAWQVGLVCIPFAVANLLIFYHLTRASSGFIAALVVGLLLEGGALLLFHDSVQGIIFSLGAASAAIVVGLVAPGGLRRLRDLSGRAQTA